MYRTHRTRRSLPVKSDRSIAPGSAGYAPVHHVSRRTVHQLEQPMQLRRGLGDLVARDPARLRDLAELRLEGATDNAASEHEADIVPATRVDEQQPVDHHVEPGLFLRLARGGTVRRLATLHPAAGEHPARTKVGRADDED